MTFHFRRSSGTCDRYPLNRDITGYLVTMRTERQERYLPIGEYALLGDGHSCALVSGTGRVDWLATPQLDAAPFLAGLVDAEDGGHFLLEPVVTGETARRYLPGTMVVETEFRSESGTLRVTDALTQGFQGRLPWSELARRIEAVDGPVPIRWELAPGTRLSTVRPWVYLDGVPFILSGSILAALILEGVGDPEVEPGRVHGEAVIEPGSPALMALVLSEDKPLRLPDPADIQRRINHTIEGWRTWSDLIRYSGPHRGQVIRSALTIKALDSADSGALAAAPTTSLPEVVGGSKNYDYRYAWVRDASFMIDALSRLGLTEEVDASLVWLLEAVRQTAPEVHVFYTLDGRPAGGDQVEKGLLEGYESSAPVTVGNKAAVQTQHGSYGDLFGAVARYVDQGGRLDARTALSLVELADKLCDEWPKPDAGLWELSDDHVYTSSLINSWNALHCAVRLSERGQVPDIHSRRWRENRDAIHRFADENCWSAAKQAYTFYAGSDGLDAAVLLAARCGFLPAGDPRLGNTIDAIRRELTAEGPLLYRYSGADKKENAFVACTFWMIEAMAIAGRTQEAAELLEGALGHSNDLGLWSEEIEPTSGRLTGNFPIGISHLAVIGAITAFAHAAEKAT